MEQFSGGLGGRGIPVAVVQTSIVGLVEPLEEDRVELSGRGAQHADDNRDVCCDE